MGQITETKKKFSTTHTLLSTQDKILELLRYGPGYTIADLSKLLKISRNTIVVSLAWLEGREVVNIKRIGMAKIYSLKNEIKMEVENK